MRALGLGWSMGLVLLSLSACSGDPDAAAETGSAANTPRSSSNGRAGNGSTPGSANSGPPVVIDGFGRPPGMAIGQGAGDEDDGETTTPLPLDPSAPDPDDVEIPVFETPPPQVVAPCTGCVELSAVIDDINQRSDFTFDAGGVAITGVTWTILIPFNSDQLFMRSFVNGTDGTYTFMSANLWPMLNTRVQFVQQINTTATTVGFAIGSAGAWTGDQRISIFVDSVTLEGAPNAGKTFDTDAGGFTARGTERSPSVVFHP